MSDDPLHALGHAAKARDEERERWLAEPSNAELVEPLTAEEEARLLGAVLPPEPVRLRPRVAARWAVAGALAMAAAAAFAVLVPRGPTSLPEFALEVPSIGYSAVRGDPRPGPVLRLSAGMAIEVVLRPQGAWTEPVAARAFVEQAGGRRTLEWAPTIAPTGAARFVGEVGRELTLPPGRARLGFAVGAPARVAGELTEGSDLRVLWLDVDVVP